MESCYIRIYGMFYSDKQLFKGDFPPLCIAVKLVGYFHLPQFVYLHFGKGILGKWSAATELSHFLWQEEMAWIINGYILDTQNCAPRCPELCQVRHFKQKWKGLWFTVSFVVIWCMRCSHYHLVFIAKSRGTFFFLLWAKPTSATYTDDYLTDEKCQRVLRHFGWKCL